MAIFPAPSSPILLPGPKEDFPSISLPTTEVAAITIHFFEKREGSFEIATESVQARFLFMLAGMFFRLHARGELDRLRECLECKNLFFAEHGRQQFCSPKCKGREHSRRFRERHSEELRTKAHTRYEKKVRKKLGRPRQTVGQFRKAKTAQKKS